MSKAAGSKGKNVSELNQRKESAAFWFRFLRDDMCDAFEKLEREAGMYHGAAGMFERKHWEHPHGGGGEISVMKGRLFEKVGVNISTVHGEFSEAFRKEIPGASDDPRFWASGVSLVAHLVNPHIPAVHLNTRFIVVGEGGMGGEVTGRLWFGGGADLTPMFPDEAMAEKFHAALKSCCNRHDERYYPKFSKWCDEYFFIKHRNEPRGAGGIFYDYLGGDWEADFAFTQDVGKTFLAVYPEIIRGRMEQTWTADDREKQLIKRGRYAEFNLVYDRGTRFGLMTDGNADAILMSLPPEAKWP